MSTLREQIAARRAEVKKTATPIKGQARHVPSVDSLSEERTATGQIKLAVRSGTCSRSMGTGVRPVLMITGKLDITGLNLHRIPVEVYTVLAGIDTESLTRPPSPPRPKEAAIRPLGSGAATPRQDTKEAVFNQPSREVWGDPEELTAFRAADNRILEIEREIGAFGGLRSIDVSHVFMPVWKTESVAACQWTQESS
jgi:hypothetical protein